MITHLQEGEIYDIGKADGRKEMRDAINNWCKENIYMYETKRDDPAFAGNSEEIVFYSAKIGVLKLLLHKLKSNE